LMARSDNAEERKKAVGRLIELSKDRVEAVIYLAQGLSKIAEFKREEKQIKTLLKMVTGHASKRADLELLKIELEGRRITDSERKLLEEEIEAGNEFAMLLWATKVKSRPYSVDTLFLLAARSDFAEAKKEAAEICKKEAEKLSKKGHCERIFTERARIYECEKKQLDAEWKLDLTAHTGK